VVASVVDHRDPKALDAAHVVQDKVVEVVDVTDVSAVLLVDHVARDEDAIEDEEQLERQYAVDIVFVRSDRVAGLLTRST
jgi:hypothetical protein